MAPFFGAAFCLCGTEGGKKDVCSRRYAWRGNTRTSTSLKLRTDQADKVRLSRDYRS
jgi:hypothetical protein